MSEFIKEHPSADRSDLESVEDLKLDAGRKLNSIGSVLMARLNDEEGISDILGGPLYESDNQEVLLAQDGQLYLISDGTPRHIDIVANLDTYYEVLIQHLEDFEITSSRNRLAQVLSASEPDLEVPLRKHLAFNEGRIEPVEKEGIMFYAVFEDGGSAVYMGIKDGKRYVLVEKVSCSCGQCEVGEYHILDENVLLDDQAAA